MNERQRILGFSVVILVAACAAIWGGSRQVIYVAKPLTTGLILLLALTSPGALVNRYKLAVGVGLVWSLAGDVFLMVPGDYFLPGLGSFFLAHVAYLVALTSGARLGARWEPLLVAAGLEAVLLPLIWPGVPVGLRLPVTAYATVLLVMAAQASARALVVANRMAWAAAVGAVFFVASDSLLALRRFRPGFVCPGWSVLVTYYLAQWLIALSVGRDGEKAVNRD